MSRQSGLAQRAAYYVRGQASSVRSYLAQGALTTLFGPLPGVLGIALRGLVYRFIMRMDGFAAIESGVRLCHTDSIRLGRSVFLDHGVYLHGTPGGIDIGADTCVMHNAELHVFNFRDLPTACIRIGAGCFIGESVIVRGQGGVHIADSVLVGPMAKILAVDHVFNDPARPVIEQGISARGISIGRGAWIGAGAAVLDGVRIGAGAVIGANAVVTRDIPAHTVAVGSPARVLRQLTTVTAA